MIFRACFFNLHRVSLGRQTVVDFSQPLKVRRAVREFLIANWGNLASVAGLLVSLGALFFARSAAATAKLVRQEMQRHNLYEALATLVSRVQELLMLQRLKEWDLVRLRSDDIVVSLTVITTKWKQILGVKSTKDLLQAKRRVRSVAQILDRMNSNLPDQDLAAKLISMTELSRELIISAQASLSYEIETGGVKL